MEFLGQPGPFGACNLLGVPGPSSLDVDDDEDEVVIGIRPKSSPLPRRRSSATDEDSEPEPPLCGSRRVSFADAIGLSLVHVKEFDTWDVPKLPGYDSSEGEGIETEEYFLSPLTFSLPLSTEELLAQVREQKVALETIKLLPGTTILKGVIRVLNISFTKAVYIRTTLDAWSTHFDLLAEYIPSSSDGLMDRFSFKLTLIPPFEEQGARVDFCLRYETPVGTFWANNNDKNYVLFCHQRAKEVKEKPQKENVAKKSCLKAVSQNFSTVENISANEASSQENSSTDVSTFKDKKVSDGQLETSEKHTHELLMESRQNSSRRSRRKAARMARVRDLFAQRGGAPNGTERDESPPEIQQAVQEETPERAVQSFSEGKSEDSQLVSESLEMCSQAVHNDLGETSPAHDYTSNREPEKSESCTLADSATETRDAPDIPDIPLHSVDECPPAEKQNINEFVTKAEETRSYDSSNNTAAVSSENLVSQNNSFTFGTVVAPLYHQVFGRAGSEIQSTGDWGNPEFPASTTGDLNPSIAGRQTSCTDQTDAVYGDCKVQENVNNNKESDHECLGTTLNSPAEVEEEETSVSGTVREVLDSPDTVQDPTEAETSDQRSTHTSHGPTSVSGDILVHPETVNMSVNTDLLNPQIPTSLHLKREIREDNLTLDLQSQTTAEMPQGQQLNYTCTENKADPNEILGESVTQEVGINLQSSLTSLQSSQSGSEHVIEETEQPISSKLENSYECEEFNKDHDTGKTVAMLKTNTPSKEEKLLEVLHDLNSNHIDNSVTQTTQNGLVSGCELDKTEFITPEASTQEESDDMEEGNKVTHSSQTDETKHSGENKLICEIAESMTKEALNNCHKYGDDEDDTLGKVQHCEMDAAVSEEDEGFGFADNTAEKNWEMMVEEEENTLLTNTEDSELMNSKAEDTEALEEDPTESKEEEKEDEFEEEIAAAGVKEVKVDAVVGMEETEEEINETGAENEFEYVEVTKTEKAVEMEEVAEVEETEGSEETGLQIENHFVEMQQVNIKKTNVQEEKEMEGEEKMEIDLNDEGEAGVGWDGQVKLTEEIGEEENPDCTEETQDVDADSCMSIEDGEDEVGCLEERVDITQNKGEDGLCALVNNGHEGVSDKENTEGQNVHIQTEIHLYKEEGSHSDGNFTHERSKAENESSAAEGSGCVLTDEPENDQTSSHDGFSADSESDSDDEVELYMHCLRAVRGAQAHKDRNRDTGFTASKRPSVSRSKRLSIPMPSISESVDEEQHLSHQQETCEDTQTAAVTALSAPGGQETLKTNVSRWKDTFSCSNVTKTLLYTTLFVVFLVVAYHYDFLACFGLYLISVVWLCCQGERHPVKNNRMG